MASPGIAVAGDALVWRVGRAPDPWAWVDRSYAGHNRWDDANGVFRTIYAGDSLYACFVELLAYARPDVGLDGSDLLACIVEDPADAAEHPVSAAGALPRDWIQARMVASAKLTGSFADMRSSEMIAALRPQFVQLALRLGYHDFDAAAVKSAQHRALTQQVASYLYTLVSDHGVFLYDGIRFASRHGDDLVLWAIFERAGDEPASQHLQQTGTPCLVDLSDKELNKAMSLHHLSWLP